MTTFEMDTRATKRTGHHAAAGFTKPNRAEDRPPAAPFPLLDLPSDLLHLVATFLPHSEVVCHPVPACKALHDRLPSYRTVRLCQPVPHHAFRARYAAIDGKPSAGMKALNLRDRRRLLRATAAMRVASGCQPGNLDLLLSAGESGIETVGSAGLRGDAGGRLPGRGPGHLQRAVGA